MSKKSKILEKLANATRTGDREAAREVAEDALNAKVDPIDAIENGLAKGLRGMGEGFERGEVFVPELLMGAEAMKAGMEVLKSALTEDKKKGAVPGKVVFGVTIGDIHDIGKTLVISMLNASGFDVVDLGVDVADEIFVEKVRELTPDIVGIGALMTTTREGQKTVIEALKDAGLRDKVKVIVGGAATTQDWAEEIGADGYGEDAMDAVRIARNVMGIK
jgi:corrinoid protein of di/trimethylamine methyltransferase